MSTKTKNKPTKPTTKATKAKPAKQPKPKKLPNLTKHQKRVMRRMVAGAPVFSKLDKQHGIMRLGETVNSYKPAGKRALEALEAHGLIQSRQEASLLVWTPTEEGRNSPGLIQK